MPVTQRYAYPRALARSQAFTVTVDGQPVSVLATSAGHFCQWEQDGPVTVRIQAPQALEDAPLKPLARRLRATAVAGALEATLPGPGHYVLELEHLPALYLCAGAPEAQRPDPSDPRVRFFRAGQVYEVGILTLGPGETLYVEGGAVLRGAVRASSAHGVRIRGCGIIDNSYFGPGAPEGRQRPLLVEHTTDAVVEDIVLIEPAIWTCVIAACSDVRLERLRIFGSRITGDGIDIVGSDHIRIRDCLIRAGDDCIVLKSCDFAPEGADPGYLRNVHDVIAERCVLHSFSGGSALEIGHELRCQEVHDVIFRDIDILGVHEWGAAIALHNCDHATVHHVLYEDIRIEHYWVWLIDCRVVHSMYARTPERGRIQDITFRRLAVTQSRYNRGVSTSHFAGFDPEHRVERLRFEGCTVNGQPLRSLDDIDGFIRHADAPVFLPG